VQTLSYGFLLPEAGDKGSSLWGALEDNITRVNGHTHDGTDSAPIPGKNIASATQAISAAGWADYGGPTGHVRQLVTMVAGYTFDGKNIHFRTAGGEYVYPSVVKASGTSFYIYSTDNTLDLVAVYGG
jgi:hypothetical protein